MKLQSTGHLTFSPYIFSYDESTNIIFSGFKSVCVNLIECRTKTKKSDTPVKLSQYSTAANLTSHFDCASPQRNTTCL